MADWRWGFQAAGFFFVAAFLGVGVPDGSTALPPLSAKAVAALENPPERLEPSVARELEAIWAERSRAYFRSLMGDEDYEFESQVWVDRLAGKPYLHFKASGQNRGYPTDPRHNVVVVLFLGPTRAEIDTEFGNWFAPFQNGEEYIRTVDIGAQRAALTNITDDGTQSLFWQQDHAFLEVRSREDVEARAREAHAQAVRSGLYRFPQSYLLTSFADTSGVAVTQPESGPAAAEAAEAEAPQISGPRRAPQPSQQELATGWERISTESERINTGGESPPPSSTTQVEVEPRSDEGPRIPMATLGLALHAAIRRDEPSPLLALIKAGAGLESRDAEGRTPLMIAVEVASADLVRLLVNEGARLEAIPVGAEVTADNQGMTPLMFAARAGRAEIIRVLVESGASLTAVNGRGNTALEIAAEGDNEPALYLLRQAAGLEPLAEEGTGPAVIGGEGPDPAASPGGWLEPAGEDSSGQSASGSGADVETDAESAPRIPEAAASQRPGLMERDLEALRTEEGATLVTSVGEVRVWQARLEGAWRRLNVDLNEDTDATVLRAVILNWDARVTPESTGVMGYEYWRAALAKLSPEDPVTAPDPSAALSDERVVLALKHGAANLRRDFDSIEVPYHRRDY